MSLSQEEQLYVEMLCKQIEMQKEYIEEVRSVKHDMYAHMMVLHHYLQREEYDRANAYLTKLMKIPIFEARQDIDVGNDVVNAVLQKKLQSCPVDVELETSGLLPEPMWIGDLELCTLFSNLISNSLEACEKLEENQRKIQLRIEETLDGISICFVNPVAQSVDLSEFGTQTTKEDKVHHGYGFKNIKRIVEQYCGEMHIECSDGLVLVKIALPDIA